MHNSWIWRDIYIFNMDRKIDKKWYAYYSDTWDKYTERFIKSTIQRREPICASDKQLSAWLDGTGMGGQNM